MTCTFPDCGCSTIPRAKFCQNTPKGVHSETGEISRLRAVLDTAERERRFIIDERDRTFTLMLTRAEAAEAKLAQAVEALTQLRDLMCEAIEDDDGNSGCGQCQNDCSGCIAHAVLAALTKGDQP